MLWCVKNVLNSGELGLAQCRSRVLPDQQAVFLYNQLRKVSKNFTKWVGRPLSDRAKDNEWLIELIRASHAASGRIYGARRATADLKEAGEGCGKDRIARLMRINGIRGVTGYKVRRPWLMPHYPGRKARM